MYVGIVGNLGLINSGHHDLLSNYFALSFLAFQVFKCIMVETMLYEILHYDVTISHATQSSIKKDMVFNYLFVLSLY